MAKSDRQERHLMRQRGAGARLLMPSLNFAFGSTVSKSKSKPVRTPSRTTPGRSIRQRTQNPDASPTAQPTKTPAHIRIEVPVVASTKKAIPRTPSNATPRSGRRRAGSENGLAAALAADSARRRQRGSTGRRSAGRRSVGRRISAFTSLVAAESAIKPGRKAKFHEQMEASPKVVNKDGRAEEISVTEELAAQAQDKKPKKTTRRKRKPVTMPKSRKTVSKKAVATKTEAATEDAPVDPADLAEANEPAREARTSRKRKSGDMLPTEASDNEDGLGSLRKKARLQLERLEGGDYPKPAAARTAQTLKGRFQKLRSLASVTSLGKQDDVHVKRREADPTLDQRIAQFTGIGAEPKRLVTSPVTVGGGSVATGTLRAAGKARVPASPGHALKGLKTVAGGEHGSAESKAVAVGKRKVLVADDSDGEGRNWFIRRGRKKA